MLFYNKSLLKAIIITPKVVLIKENILFYEIIIKKKYTLTLFMFAYNFKHVEDDSWKHHACE